MAVRLCLLVPVWTEHLLDLLGAAAPVGSEEPNERDVEAVERSLEALVFVHAPSQRHSLLVMGAGHCVAGPGEGSHDPTPAPAYFLGGCCCLVVALCCFCLGLVSLDL